VFFLRGENRVFLRITTWLGADNRCRVSPNDLADQPVKSARNMRQL
jgi:hypothetical protein